MLTYIFVALLVGLGYYALYLLNALADAKQEVRRWQGAVAAARRQVQELRSAVRWLGWDPDEDGYSAIIRDTANEAQQIEVAMAKDFQIHRQQIRLDALRRYQSSAYPMRQIVSDARRTRGDANRGNGKR